MTTQTLKDFALSMAVLGVALIPSLSPAQVGLAPKLPGSRAASSTAHAASRKAETPGSPTYTYTLLSHPGTLATYAYGMNKGATSSKVEIVGGYGTEGGFFAQVSGTKTIKEAYQTVDDPHGTQQWANGINDLGQIVGGYLDSSGFYHGYERSSSKFTQIDVPFTGAFNTTAGSINNSGEIVGGYTATDGEQYGFTLIGGAYTSINYPGATFTFAGNVNDNGDIVGWYTDASGITHGFLLSGGTYTSLDFPGATETLAAGINDAGDIVGVYCATSGCVGTLDGAQGFLLSGETFATITIPGESYTQAADINNNGVVVGFYQDAAGLVVSFMAAP
ncbi:MAG: hypothetical protein WBQ43_01960 [Terriglobales bacterium]